MYRREGVSLFAALRYRSRTRRVGCAAVAEVLRGRVLGGQFTIGACIGKGGYGWVFEARQANPDRVVAVKVLRQRAADPTGARVGEAQALARASHPNAVGVISSGIEPEDGLQWIAMELVGGTDLRRWLHEFGPMPLATVVPLVEQVADALYTAHMRGIVHRDIKPENIMVTPGPGGVLLATLLDFGIAKSKDGARPDLAEMFEDEPGDESARDGAITSRGVVSSSRTTRRRQGGRQRAAIPTTPTDGSLGTPEYRAPEMARDARTAGPAADVYALGLIVYEALAGRLPFKGYDKEEWRELHETSMIGPIGVGSAAVYRAVHRALAKHPEDRPTPIEFAKSLRAALVADPAEQARASAQLWEARGRSPDLLWGPAAIAAVERRQQLAQDDMVTKAFFAASRRRAQAFRWKVIAAVLAVTAVGAAYRSRKNDETSEALLTQAEVEQGRQAELLGDSARAAEHLRRAYQRGDHSWSTEFMLARSIEPQRAELARLQALKGRVWSVTSSSDGRQIATADEGGVQVWDARSFQRIYALPHADVVYDAAFTADGAQLITACGDGAVRIWTAADGKLVRALRDEGHARYAKLAVRGETIAAMDFAGTSMLVWNAKTGEIVAALHGKKEAVFLSLAFSPSGRWIATNIGDQTHVLNTMTWQERISTVGAARSLSWDPIEDRLAVGAPSGDISIWGVDGHRALHLREIGSPVDIVVFSPDAKHLGVADHDGTLRVWDATNGRQRSQIPRPGPVRSLAFDAASELVAVGSHEGSVSVFEAATGLQVSALDGAKDGVWSLRFDGQRLIAASWSGATHIWDARSRHRAWVTDATADACGVLTSTEVDRRFVAVGCEGHATRVWDTGERKLLAGLPPMSAPDGDWTAVLPVVSADGSRAAIARGNAAEVYELPGGRLLRTIVHAAPVSALAFGSGRDVVTGATNGTIQLTHDGQQPIALLAAPAGIDTVGVLPDGRVVATDAGKHLRVISSSGVDVLEAPTRITLLRPSTDGRLVTLPGATIPSLRGRADPAALWDLRGRGGHLVAELRGNLGRVVTARWTDRGVVTVGADGTARLWDATGHLVREYEVLTQHRLLVDVAVSLDGKLLAAGGADGLVEFWDFGTGRELWSLRAHAAQVVGLHFEGAELVTRGFGGELSRWHFDPAADVIRAYGDPMRKSIPNPRLHVGRETIRELGTRDLRRALGAADNSERCVQAVAVVPSQVPGVNGCTAA
jgi:WD40 repeat protein/serine/threonine protein kinase